MLRLLPLVLRRLRTYAPLLLPVLLGSMVAAATMVMTNTARYPRPAKRSCTWSLYTTARTAMVKTASRPTT